MNDRRVGGPRRAEPPPGPAPGGTARARSVRGTTLPELLAVLAILAAVTLAAAPSVAHLRTAGRAAAGARHMATQMQAIRWNSVALRKYRGMWFERDGSGWSWYLVEDGNGNGLRTAELRAGTDRVVSGPHRLEEIVGDVTLGFPDVGPIPEIPPKKGTLADLDDPIRFGRPDLISFGPLGSSSSGTLYVTDGTVGLYAVVLFGPSTRIRVWRYDPTARRWSL